MNLKFTLPLEDNVFDVLTKAQRGQGISIPTLAKLSGIEASKLESIESLPEQEVETLLPALAKALTLSENGLKNLLLGLAKTEEVNLEGLELFNTHFGDMTVNSYLIWCPNTKKAIAFDTGACAKMLLQRVHELSLKLEGLFITHTHSDHIADIAAFEKIPCWVHEKEPCEGATKFTMGKTWQIGDLKIESRATHGHASAGTTYCVSGLSHKVLVVGDALFAFSMGGAKISYSDALRTNRESIFIEADEVVIAPGHGPMTTVGEQRLGNPFFAH